MKRKLLLTIITLFGVFMIVNAQTQVNVTKFLGIPVDGTKREMIQLLTHKGFDYLSLPHTTLCLCRDTKVSCLRHDLRVSKIRHFSIP